MDYASIKKTFSVSMKFAVQFIIYFSLAACSTTEKLSEPKAPAKGMSAIYIYRPSSFEDGALSTAVTLDGAGEKELPKCGFLHIEVSPGRHTISVIDKSVFGSAKELLRADTTIEPNTISYMRYSIPSNALNIEAVTGGGCSNLHIFTEASDLKFTLQLASSGTAIREFSNVCARR